MGQPVPPSKPLSNDERTRWNAFIDYVKGQGMQNHPSLDQRNKQIGNALLQKFNYTNPSQALPMDVVPRVQQDLQSYRQNLIQQWKAGKTAPIEGVKSENDIMSGISPVDSWPGTKTLSNKYPVASLTASDGSKKDFGTNMDAYNAAIAIPKK